MAANPLVGSSLAVTGGDKDTVALVAGGNPGATTGSGAVASGPVTIADAVPSVTTNKLYNSSGVLFWSGQAVGRWSMIAQGTTTSTSATPANLLTAAISGLTAQDSLMVQLSFYQASAASGTVFLYNATDSVNVWGSAVTGLSNATLNWATSLINIHCCDPSGLKAVSSSGPVDTATLSQAPTFTTNWTGNWTLALRIAGTSGTIRVGWTVYKLTGQ